MNARSEVALHRSPPSFAQSTWRVFDLSLGLMLWSRRTIFMALIVCGPVALAAIVRLADALGHLHVRVQGGGPDGGQIFGMMFWLFYLRFIVPVLAVFYGTSLVADEVEDKTLTYLFTRPIRRGAVLVGKYLAYLVSTILVVLPSVLGVYFLMASWRGAHMAASFPNLLVDFAVLAAALTVYGAVFAFVGTRFPRPLVTGLVFLFGWEPAVLLIPGYLKRFSVMYYVQALVPHTVPVDDAPRGLLAIFRETPALSTSVLALSFIAVLFLVLAVRTVEQREYVLEQ